MSEHDETPKHTESAVEEVLREVEEAERRTEESDEDRRHQSEAGEAITPNTQAQEESQGE
ncbi:hypothetical protein OG986_30965 [Streptomyces cellulosae]|uniref:Uncharacterized protein n=1 Tax=Streptomyces thermodiastaticus TaxID=44061 RepID=A0ABU0KQS6_9ACTN|nr:hypothetical protein [Streptomyces sp. McG7]MDQ0491793.1 hypothetical protein [Streptomyces thermodiastaticus]THC58880.1 hypothetical protein E7X38_04095 [Streptomyces sp. Akac8]UVT13234.1 hypothetical protein AY578_30695 [Streptomyces thermocarboxydus]WSB45069.1 hypothetical protein OG853_31265 [Streptomyces cellulosae]